MSRPRMPKKYAIDDIRSRFQTVAIDNRYQAFFKPNGNIYDAASRIGINSRFLDEDLGLYVSDAVLPGSSFADIEIAGDRQGITERVPFSRLYDDVTFTFMVDNEYKVMRFFESWMSLVNPLYGTTSASTSNQVMTLNYPKSYKCDMAIAKFNKDYDLTREGGIVLMYQFNEAWPFSIASTPVNYDGGNVLKLNVTFRYTRYFVYDVTTVGERYGRYGRSDSNEWFLGNKRQYLPTKAIDGSIPTEDERNLENLNVGFDSDTHYIDYNSSWHNNWFLDPFDQRANPPKLKKDGKIPWGSQWRLPKWMNPWPKGE